MRVSEETLNRGWVCMGWYEVTGRRHRVSPRRSAYFASPWRLLTLTSEDVGEEQLCYSQSLDGI